MIKAGIIGATGYTGVELLRLLCGHPDVEITLVTSRTEAGRLVSDLFPNLRGVFEQRFSAPDPVALRRCDVVFFSTPNGTAMEAVPELLEAGVRVIDLAADFRLKDPQQWRQWYGVEHSCPQLLQKAIYGLPELNREAIRNARLVANPGCYPTAVQLGFIPLLENNLVDPAGLIADAKSGVSGAGRKGDVANLLCEAGESVKAYKVPGHRHLPEILQGLNLVSKEKVSLTFVPHMVPMIRGIHATLYARLTDTKAELQQCYRERYDKEPFVYVMPAGSHPETRNVRGANQCQIAIHRPHDSDTVVVLVVIDNLVKGAAGQAVQNMNIMFGLGETVGLTGIALLP